MCCGEFGYGYAAVTKYFGRRGSGSVSSIFDHAHFFCHFFSSARQLNFAKCQATSLVVGTETCLCMVSSMILNASSDYFGRSGDYLARVDASVHCLVASCHDYLDPV